VYFNLKTGGNEIMDRTVADREDLVQCPVCDYYLKKSEGFTCVKCKRGILCKKHQIEGSKECASCVFDRKNREYMVLKEQEMNLKNVLRFFQFLFLVFAVFFIALRAGLGEIVEILQSIFITEGLVLLGIASAAGYIVFYFILFNQRGKTAELEAEVRKINFKR